MPDRTKSEDQYYKIIEKLKLEYVEISGPFITEIHGLLYWNKTPKKGWVQYMAAFIKTCIDKKWILSNYSASEYKRILKNTFNVDFDLDPFKSIEAAEFDDKYMKPFKNYPTNI